MAENLVDLPFSSVSDIIDTPSNNTVYNNVDLKTVNKIQIVYTRSFWDYCRWFLFFILKVLFIIVLFWSVLWFSFIKSFSVNDKINNTVNSINFPKFDTPLSEQAQAVNDYFWMMDDLLQN